MVLHFSRYAQLRAKTRNQRLPQLTVGGLALELAFKLSRDKGLGAVRGCVRSSFRNTHEVRSAGPRWKAKSRNQKR